MSVVTFERLTVEETCPSGLRWRTRYQQPAGRLNRNGYWEIGYCRRVFKAHRIVALLSGIITQEDFSNPKILVDHIDGDKGNNKINNLRKADHSINNLNTEKHREGKLPYASYHKATGKWAAYRYDGTRNVYIGLFESEQKAHEAAIAEEVC